MEVPFHTALCDAGSGIFYRMEWGGGWGFEWVVLPSFLLWAFASAFRVMSLMGASVSENRWTFGLLSVFVCGSFIHVIWNSGIPHGLFTFLEKRIARNEYIPACDSTLGNFCFCSWCQVTNVMKHLCASGVSLCFAFLTCQVSNNGLFFFLNLFLVVLDLHFCMQAFSCVSRG